MKSHKYIILISVFCLVAAFSSGCGEPGVWQEPFPERLTISVVDSIGIEMGDSCYVLGAIADAEISPSETILLLDESAACVREFSSDGIFLADLSTRGNGPGELNRPVEMAVVSDGRIMVLDMARLALVLLAGTGEGNEDLAEMSLVIPQSIAPLSENKYAAWETKFEKDGDDFTIMITTGLYSMESTNQYLTFVSDTLIEEELESAFTSLKGMANSYVVVSDGANRVFYCENSTSEYTVSCWNTEGEHVFTASLPIPPVEKTDEEIIEEIDYTEMQFAMYGMNALPDGYEPDPFHTLVENLGVDSDGNLWIQRGTEAQPVFDIFDTTGDHIGTAEFPGTGKQWQFSITPYGSLAWNSDPLSGVQKVYMIELPVINI